MPVTLPAGTVHTIVVLDDSSGLKVDAVTDAAGSQIMPKGAVSVGFGGTAPRRPANPAPWLVMVAAGPCWPRWVLPGCAARRNTAGPQAGRDSASPSRPGSARSREPRPSPRRTRRPARARGVTGEVAGSYTEATCCATRRAKVRRGVRQDRIAARRSGRADSHLLVPGPAARHGDRDGAKRLQCGRLDAYLLYMLTALVAVIAVATALA